jgi:hypothetical protein
MQQTAEAETTLVDQIYKAHRRCVETDKPIRTLTIAKLNAAREAGILLQMAKKGKLPSVWAEWIRGNLAARDPQLGEAACEAYIKVAQKNPGPVDDSSEWIPALRESMIATGQIIEARGHGQQTLHNEPNFSSYVARTLNAFMAEWVKELKARPLKSWSLHKTEAFIAQITPVAKQLTDTLNQAIAHSKECKRKIELN